MPNGLTPIDLKNCPFCGEPPKLVVDIHSDRPGEEASIRAECSVCALRAPSRPNRALAIDTWNRLSYNEPRHA